MPCIMQASLKIANVIEDGRIAGPQRRIAAVANVLKGRGIQTTVIHPVQESEAFAARLDAIGIERVALPIHRLARDRGAISRYLVSLPLDIFVLWRFFRRNHFDFVHCSGGFWQIKGLIAARLAGRKVLWHLNDTVLPPWLRPVFLLACRAFANGLIVAGERVRSHYIGGAHLPMPIIEIQAPVDCAKFDPEVTPPAPELVGSSALKLVTVANLNPLKGVEHFIAMAARLSERFDGLEFYIVGPAFATQSGYVSRLKSLISENGLKNVRFIGESDNVRGILRAADVYVCSSISEASPTSVWEAMAMKKAIVATDVGDVGRFVIDGMTGYVVPPGDAQALAEAAARFLRDGALRERCGAAARKAALERLDISVCASAHQAAYSQC
jgi:glycosyltransferase involved in cell wall biosynthesis